jgi:serine/threonine protein kinase
MHRQRIAHLDIYPSNILANHVTNRPRAPFLRSFDLRLAFIDFEFSVRVPQQSPLVDVRSLPPTYLSLPEVKARNSHVDPFAADVSPWAPSGQPAHAKCSSISGIRTRKGSQRARESARSI